MYNNWSAKDMCGAIASGVVTRERACDSKVRFREFKHAEKARVDIEARHNEPNSLTTYACPFCGGWHFARAKK